MKTIYDFEKNTPPVTNTRLLEAEQARRTRQHQLMMLTLGMAFLVVCLGIFAAMIAEYAPLAALVCVGYIVITILGSGSLAVVYVRKGGVLR